MNTIPLSLASSSLHANSPLKTVDVGVVVAEVVAELVSVVVWLVVTVVVVVSDVVCEVVWDDDAVVV